MTATEVVRSMTEAQARKIVPVVRAIKAGDTAGAKAVADELSVEELDVLIAYLEAVQVEKGVNIDG